MQGQKFGREQMTVAACCSPPLPARTDITIFESGVQKHVRWALLGKTPECLFTFSISPK